MSRVGVGLTDALEVLRLQQEVVALGRRAADAGLTRVAAHGAASPSSPPTTLRTWVASERVHAGLWSHLERRGWRVLS